RPRPTWRRWPRKATVQGGHRCSAYSMPSATCAISAARRCRPLSICSCRWRIWRISLGHLCHSQVGTKNQRRRTLFLAFVSSWLPFVVVITAACGGGSKEEEVAPPEVPTIVADVAKVTRKDMTDELVVRGAIAAVPNEDVKVSALVAG